MCKLEEVIDSYQREDLVHFRVGYSLGVAVERKADEHCVHDVEHHAAEEGEHHQRHDEGQHSQHNCLLHAWFSCQCMIRQSCAVVELVSIAAMTRLGFKYCLLLG